MKSKDKKKSEKPRNIWQLGKQEKTALILDALMKAGYSNGDAAHLLDVTRQYTFKLNKKMSKGTLNPLVNKARKAVKLILDGKPVGVMKGVTGADVLAAARMVLDRSDPVKVVSENTNISMRIDITPDKRERYLKLLGIVDAEYKMLPACQKQVETSQGIPETVSTIKMAKIASQEGTDIESEEVTS